MNTLNHYINYGMAKSATSWVFSNLKNSLQIDYDDTKEPALALANNFTVYDNFYKKWNFGLNFNPNLWKLDSNQLIELGTRASHQTIILRNPFTAADSLYNYWLEKGRLDSIVATNMFIKSFANHFDYVKILERLSKNTKVLYYDDIIIDPRKFMDNLTDYLNIPPIGIIHGPINQTKYTNNLTFSQFEINLLNNLIDRYQYRVNKDLSHWKMHV